MFTDTGSPTARADAPHTATSLKTGGPKTDAGRRVAARNATTHGLFTRDVVLPHLGEDPEGYRALLQELAAQLQPRNMLEQHYTEKIAAASWRLRRLQRWQAQLFEDPDITEDEALNKLDRVMRHETTLHRQIDTSVKMLGRELPRLFQDRVRADLIRDMNATEKECREDPAMNEWVTAQTRRRIPSVPVPAGLDPATLDAAPVTTDCQNEPAPSPSLNPLFSEERACEGEGRVRGLLAGEGRTGLPSPPELGAGGRSALFAQDRQNGPAPALTSPVSPGKGEVASLSEPEGVLMPEVSPADRAWLGVPPEIVRHWTAHAHTTTKCQNEPPSRSPIIGGWGASSPSPFPKGEGRVGASCDRGTRGQGGE